MKTRILSILALVMVSCSEKINYVEIDAPQEEKEYTSHYYCSYSNKKTIDKDVLKLDDFNPGAIKIIGDTLLFSDNTSKCQAIYFYDISQDRAFKKFSEWRYNGNIQTFPNSRIEDIDVSEGRLYVANLNSQIDVFDYKSGDFITRIGTGAWGESNNQILHSHALAIKDGRLYVRTKNRMQTYQTNAITAENYQNIKWECKTATSGFEVNNSFNPYQMIDGGDRLWLTEMSANNRLISINPSLVENGTEKYIIDNNANIPLIFQPSGIAYHTSDRMFIAQHNGPIHIMNMNSRSIIHTISKIQGVDLKACRLGFSNGILIISDTQNKKISIIEVTKHEIKEFE